MTGETIVLYLCGIGAALVCAPTSFLLSAICLVMAAMLALAQRSR